MSTTASTVEIHNGMAEADKNAIIDRLVASIRVDSSGCFLWQKSKTTAGYGHFRYRNRYYYAHRVSYELLRSPILPGLYVCHRCDVRNCINPAHLFLGTGLDNMRDASLKGRLPRGESSWNAVLSQDDIVSISSLYADGVRAVALAKRFGVTRNYILDILAGKSWAHVEKPVEYSPHPNVCGVEQWNSILDDDAVREIRTSHANGCRMSDLAKKFNVTLSAVWNVVNRKTWRHVQ